MCTCFCAQNSTTGCFSFVSVMVEMDNPPICPIDYPGTDFHTEIIQQSANIMFAAFLQQFESTTDSRGDTDAIASNTTRVPQEMVVLSNPASNHSSGLLSTDEERDDETCKSNRIRKQPILQSSKTVRFAMDDKVANRKKRHRNLRNRILEKSRNSTERNVHQYHKHR